MKLPRIVDFQVFVDPSGLTQDEQRTVNQALFSTYEPVRLWLKARQLRAPFRKLLVTLGDEQVFAKHDGHVMNALGVCEVSVSVVLPALRQSASDHRWVLERVMYALGRADQSLGWRSEELESFLTVTSQQNWPLRHLFDVLATVDRSSGRKCVPWFSTRPGKTEIGVRVGDKDVTVLSSPDPVYLEDSFPLKKTKIAGREVLFLDGDGNVLAAAPL